MRFLRYLFILLAVGCGSRPTYVHGERPLKVRVIAVDMDLFLSAGELETILSGAAEMLSRDIKLPIEYTRLDYISSPCPNITSIAKSDRIATLRCLKDWLVQQKDSEVAVANYFMLPPLIDASGKRNFGGLAEHVCAFPWRYNSAWGNAASVNSDGESRIGNAIKIVAHELGHLFGAKHDDSKENVMHPSACTHSDGSSLTSDEALDLRFSQKSLDEINRCLSRGRKQLRRYINDTCRRFKNRKRNRKCRRRQRRAQ